MIKVITSTVRDERQYPIGVHVTVETDGNIEDPAIFQAAYLAGEAWDAQRGWAPRKLLPVQAITVVQVNEVQP